MRLEETGEANLFLPERSHGRQIVCQVHALAFEANVDVADMLVIACYGCMTWTCLMLARISVNKDQSRGDCYCFPFGEVDKIK